MQLTEVAEFEKPLPPPPRAITTRARRRAWGEAPVRVWGILTFLVAVSLLLLAAQNISEGLTERRLISDGKPVTATLKEVNGDGDPRHAVKMQGESGDRIVKVDYPGAPPDAEPRQLESMSSNGLRPGDAVHIRVDPNDLSMWTDATEPQPWLARLAIVWMLLPALLLAIIMLLIRRRQILRIWREGQETYGTVIELRQSPIAPRSRVVRFTLGDPDDRRIFSTLFPNRAGEINKGDELLLLTLESNPSRAIVAELYE